MTAADSEARTVFRLLGVITWAVFGVAVVLEIWEMALAHPNLPYAVVLGTTGMVLFGVVYFVVGRAIARTS